MDHIRIVAQARKQLDDSNRFNSKPIKVKVNGESLILVGQVASFFVKSVAQEAVREVAFRNDLQIDNQLEVISEKLQK